MKQDEIRYLIDNLPTTPPNGLVAEVIEDAGNELGGEQLVYRMEWANAAASLEDLYENRMTRRKRVAHCSCTACGADFMTEAAQGKSFYMLDDECGESWPVTATIADDSPEDGWRLVPYTTGDELYCPNCGEVCRVIHASKLRGGKTWRVQVATMQNVGQYTAVITWLAERSVFGPDFMSEYEAVPRHAWVIGRDGRLKAFSHREAGYMGTDVRGQGWKPLRDSHDRFDALYTSADAINNREKGTLLLYIMPPEEEMRGTTGEKTGLWRYWKDGGEYPVCYLKLHHTARGLENLVHAGFAPVLAEVIDKWHGYGTAQMLGALREAGIDTKKVKPHEMLGLSREELRAMQQLHDTQKAFSCLKKYRAAGGKETVAELARVLGATTQSDAERLIGQIGKYGDDLGKYERYLTRHGGGLHDIGLLRDCRDFASRLSPGRELTSEELWPRDLHAAHERLTAQINALDDAEQDKINAEGFVRVCERFAPIEWSDGHLAILLPREPAELRREGYVLRHCVGGYCNSHAKGKSIILFVRHARRPERCYYTLNMRFEKSEPTRIQLHGYGNEHHGERKQYRHSIPKAVTQFVDRWEKEIAAPWWRAEYLKEKNKKEKSA